MPAHGDNLTRKEEHDTKYQDEEARQFLAEIRERYDQWKADNQELVGPTAEESEEDDELIDRRVRLFREYKNFIDQQKYAEKFDSRSRLHSTVLEEFMYYLFRDLVDGFPASPLMGSARCFKDLFFQPSSFAELAERPHARQERKDHDFVIGASVETRMRCEGSEQDEEHTIHVPAVAIECKTYLDKTMLEGASNAAEQLKVVNPHGLYLVVAEWLKLTSEINLSKYQVDQIYVLRKQKNTDREFRFEPDYKKKPIHVDVVQHLYHTVRDHLTRDWEGGVEYGLERGYLI